jgi:hypothetical protein
LARHDTGGMFENLLLEFTVVMLFAGGNRCDASPYAVYFPEGYDEMRRQKPSMFTSGSRVEDAVRTSADRPDGGYRAFGRLRSTTATRCDDWPELACN